MKIKHILSLLSLTSLIGFHNNPLHAETPLTVKDISWLAGCWEVKPARPNLQQYENWTLSNAGDLMLGISWGIGGGKTKQFEFMRLHSSEGGGLAYTVLPSSLDKAISFKLSSKDPKNLVFENGSNKFPAKITYEWRAEGSFLARLEGESEGKPQKVEFPFKMVACEADKAPTPANQ